MEELLLLLMSSSAVIVNIIYCTKSIITYGVIVWNTEISTQTSCVAIFLSQWNSETVFYVGRLGDSPGWCSRYIDPPC